MVADGYTGTFQEWKLSLKGERGIPGPQGPQVSTQLSTICVVKQGSNYKLAVNTECGPSDTKLQVYIPVS